jgi:sec-independent protein translocase protein TatA
VFNNAFGWPHLLVILAVVLILFGAPKLPGLARSIGQSMRIFRSEVKTMKNEADETPAPGTVPDAPAGSPTPAPASEAQSQAPTEPKP